MNESIIRFIEKQKCASICCVNEEGNPYCFSCFYAFNAEEGLLYFKSSADTNHIKLMKTNPVIAGTILPDKLQILSIKGVQFQGLLLNEQHDFSNDEFKRYHTRYPLAFAIPGEVWMIQLNHIKMTDSSNTFGKKIQWQREVVPVS